MGLTKKKNLKKKKKEIKNVLCTKYATRAADVITTRAKTANGTDAIMLKKAHVGPSQPELKYATRNTRQRGNVATTCAKTANGHHAVWLTRAHVGPSQPELVSIRNPRGRRRGVTTRPCKTPPYDGRNQVVYEVGAAGGGCAVKRTIGTVAKMKIREAVAVKRTIGDGGGKKLEAGSHGHHHKTKGRPRGSKNKHTVSNTFNERCEKKSFAYSSTAARSMDCKACDRKYDGCDPWAHCVEYHRDGCPVCGYRGTLVTEQHVRSHGPPQPSLTVTCYECYECGEKFGNAETMGEHVRDEHVRGGEPQAGCKMECERCGVDCQDVTQLVSHAVHEHCPRKTFQHPAVYRCRVCHAGFKSQINVLRHACNKIKTPHCVACDKTFPSKMRYSFHLQFHADPGLAAPPMHLHCDICLAEFDDEYQLYDHIRFRHELHDKAVCEICGRTFKSSMGLNIHRRYHTGSRNFGCKSCDKSFLNRSTLREHEISHMDVKPFQCHICGQYLSRASRLRSHVKTHKAAESTAQLCYCCERCGFVAPSPEQLAEHGQKEHQAAGRKDAAADILERSMSLTFDDGQPPSAVELESVVKCEYCDSTYVNAATLDSHREAAHANRGDCEAFICVVCSSTFSTYSRLTTHKLTHGINMDSAWTAAAAADSNADDPGKDSSCKDRFEIPQYFSCQYCAKMCLHYTYFCLHRRLKHPVGLQHHVCDHCSLEFKTSWRLAYHKKTVHGQPQPQHQQQQQQAVFNRSSAPYECNVCRREFAKIGALNLHKTRTHIDITGDVCKYLCHVCGKFFSSECSLRNHSKSHLVVVGGNAETDRKSKRRRTYRKSTTSTTTTTSAALIKPQAAKKRHSCPYCDATTDDNAEFIEHVNRHIMECSAPAESIQIIELAVDPVQPTTAVISCDLCDQDFAEHAAQNLAIHLAEHAASQDAFLCAACFATFFSRAALDAHHSVCRSDEKMAVDPSLAPPLLLQVVECLEIMSGGPKPEPWADETPDGPKPEVGPVPEVGATKVESPLPIDEALESSLIDELMDIMATPTALDQHSNLQDLDDLFECWT